MKKGILIAIITSLILIFLFIAFSNKGQDVDMIDFDRSVLNLDLAENSEIIEYPNISLSLSADIIKKEVNGGEIRMFGYNGQIPGPIIKVKQGEELEIEFTNNLDQDTTVHWHGLRLDNEFDGVPGMTQEPIQPGQKFIYKLKFPDAGLYWYHPHIREDYQQELGLYGNILVESSQENKKFNREEFLFLDDIQLYEGDVTPFYQNVVYQTLMGRFGNVMLVNGQEKYDLIVNEGEVVRFYLTNSANTRVFNLKIPGARIKVVGSDVGYYENEFFSDSVILAPSERAIIDIYFDKSGNYELKNINPLKEYSLGTVKVVDGQVLKDFSQDFLILDKNDGFSMFEQYSSKPADVELVLDIKMGSMEHGLMQNMDHGMHGGGMMAGSIDGIEWEDTMAMMNYGSTNKNVEWLITDKKTGKTNEDIDYKWNVGDYVKIRLFNDPNSMHPMQHPIHFHGNRFVVLSKDGINNENMVWKDTVLVPIGATYDIILEVSNPGEWMAHCHIAEHLESGMMAKFEVMQKEGN